MLPEFFQFQNPTKVVYGPGLANDISAELSQFTVQKLAIVTDKIIRGLEKFETIVAGLKEAGVDIVGIFDEVPPDSSVKVIEQAAEMAKKWGAQGLVAIGGGSVIDTAKGMNILMTLGGSLVEDYSGSQTIGQPLNPLIVIPTTAGTGSEVTQAAVILDEENGVKIVFTDRYLLPNLAILDPETTLTLPPKLTAATGMDALTHAVEAIHSIEANPFTEGISLFAIKMIKEYLVRATTDGSDIEARGGMLVASCMAGTAFSQSMVGCIHGMAHSCGGLYHVHHGLANAILLPYGMEYNLEVSAPGYKRIAQALGCDVAGLSDEEGGKVAIQSIRDLNSELNKACGMPIKLGDAGVKKDGLGKLAEMTVDDGTSFYNPREVVAEEILKQLEKAY